MSKVTFLQPDLILGDTVFGITTEVLHHHQLKGLVLDVDETLVPLRERQVSEALVCWIEQIRNVATIWLVSNNLSENRIGSIAQSLNVPYILGAGKPSRRKLRQAVRSMNLPASQVAMVGDRLFTDVIAGNRLGMFTILVEPMVDPAIAARSYPIRNLEVWISQKLGVSLATNLQKFTKND
ncbi:MAG: YqeG family HAD IIIA-type phosphatase [Hydrococcus sp. Prado102]|jgi:hypothetical protein|nr:YqeG family HAD IIIA-type phosphatase [Hydrococcus sp. Prado102]